jgi:hypothetical protein
MVDVVLSTVDLDVFGGPTSLNVSTDFGKAGERGTRVWVGNGNPALVLTTQPVALYDLFINTNTSDQFYSWLYQYVPEVGGPAWQRVLRLNPSQHSRISVVQFEDGFGVLDIPLSVITSDTNVIAGQFIVRYNLENSSNNPVLTSFTYSIETILGVKYLRINVRAAEWNGSTTGYLNGSHKVHAFISYLS